MFAPVSLSGALTLSWFSLCSDPCSQCLYVCLCMLIMSEVAASTAFLFSYFNKSFTFYIVSEPCFPSGFQNLPAVTLHPLLQQRLPLWEGLAVKLARCVGSLLNVCTVMFKSVKSSRERLLGEHHSVNMKHVVVRGSFWCLHIPC